jgi:heme O synthase-like polyprenyltransferase
VSGGAPEAGLTAALRARQLFFASILYLPLLLAVMVLDKVK